MSGIDIRDAFFEEICAIGAEDPNFVLLADDMDAFALKPFRENFPERFINIGVAEQNLINLATGLATCGKKVCCLGIATFITFRCYEQIKLNLASMNLPVLLVGIGAGFSFGFDGPSHHGTQDIACMRILPEMTIYNPGDVTTAALSARWSLYENQGPSYVRLDKGVFPRYYERGDDFSKGYRILKPLQKTNLVATGFMVPQAMALANSWESEGKKIGVVDLFRIKPVDVALTHEVLKSSSTIISLEENDIVGGIGTLLAELVQDAQLSTKLLRIGSENKQFIDYGSRDYFHQINRIDVASIKEKAEAWI